MNKLLKIVGIIALVAVVGYLFVLMFVSPDFDNDKVTLVTHYMENITSDDVCTDHFNPDTLQTCTTIKTQIEDLDEFTYEVVLSGQSVDLTITDTTSSNTVEFTFSFIEETNTGLSGFFHKTNYLIDLVQ